jgi:hypothetical protein
MNDLRRCTVAIARKTGRRSELVGAGVCMMINDGALALSAGHLLRSGPGDLWLGSAGRTIRLWGAMTLGAGPETPLRIRQLNVGFAPLLPDDLERLAGLECVSPLVVDGEDAPPTVDYVAVAPAEPTGLGGRRLAAREAPPDEYRRMGVEPATHVVVDTLDAVAATAGLLGCGLWRPATGAPGDRLTGIVIDVKPVPGSNARRLVATRADLLLSAICGVLGLGATGRQLVPKRRAERTH